MSADGLKIYVACDSIGNTSGPTGNVLTTPPNPGSILEFTYTPGPALMKYAALAQATQQNVSNKTIDVYPNPASNFIVVYDYSTENNRRAVLYDLNGRAVRQKVLSSRSSRINTSDLAAGLYILKVVDAKNAIIRVEKIVISH